MKIKSDRISSVAISSIKPGEVFEYSQILYMKTVGDESMFNCVRLHDGKLIRFAHENTSVIPRRDAVLAFEY